MTNIFIANLDWTITSEDLEATFSSFGEVTYAHVVYEKDTKRSKGFGYIENVYKRPFIIQVLSFQDN